MKKILLVVAVFAIFTAQRANAQDLNLGVKGGVNFSNLKGDNADGDMRTGFHLGLFAEYMLNDQFAIQPEVLYSTQGLKGKGDSEMKMDYVNIPVMLKYYAAPGFSLQAGPQIGFITKSEYKVGDASLKGDEDAFKALDFGVNFGLGYKFTDNMFVEGRYNLGLNNVFDDEKVVKIDAKNSVFQVSVGYIF